MKSWAGERGEEEDGGEGLEGFEGWFRFRGGLNFFFFFVGEF